MKKHFNFFCTLKKKKGKYDKNRKKHLLICPFPEESQVIMTNIQHHLLELKFRLFYVILSGVFTFLISYNCQLELIYIIGKPFIKTQQTFVFLELTEAFYVLLQMSTILTTLVLVPFMSYHLFGFFIPSLYQTERHEMVFNFFFFFFVILSESVFTYCVLFPKICDFFMSFEISHGFHSLMSVEFTARIKAYVALLVKIFTLTLVVLQLPVFIYFLYSKNLVRVSSFYCNRKICGLVSVLLSAFVVPPDVVSQLVCSFFFIFVFEIFIFIGLFFDDVF